MGLEHELVPHDFFRGREHPGCECGTAGLRDAVHALVGSDRLPHQAVLDEAGFLEAGELWIDLAARRVPEKTDPLPESSRKVLTRQIRSRGGPPARVPDAAHPPSRS